MAAHDGDVRWPPSAAQERLLGQLAELVGRGGAWRFLHGPVVAAGPADFPDRWEPSRAAVARLLARMMWHAHVPLEVGIDDARGYAPPGGSDLRASQVELDRVEASRAWFAIYEIGNDDVAGVLSHQVGRAFAAQLARGGHPFRAGVDTTEDDLPDLAAGTLAAVYLGLGVLACNSAHHERTAGKWVANYVQHEHTIGQAGGLDWHDLAFLVAVQATVRDDVLPALETLHRTQRIEVAAWRELLDEREDELRVRLGLSGEPDEAVAAPARPSEPLPLHASALEPEADARKFNTGHRTYRVPHHRGTSSGVLGATAGLTAGVIMGVVGLGLPLFLGAIAVGTLGGFALGRRARFFRCAEPRCALVVGADDAVCPHCGGAIAGEIAHPDLRLARDEELDEVSDDASRPG